MGWDWVLTGMSYGPRLQQQRMLLHQFLHRTAMKRHHGILTLETHRLIANLLNSPDKFSDHVGKYSSLQHFPCQTVDQFGRSAMVAIIMMIAYGYEGNSSQDQVSACSHIGFSCFTRRQLRQIGRRGNEIVRNCWRAWRFSGRFHAFM
jgi:hypothetical protein